MGDGKVADMRIQFRHGNQFLLMSLTDAAVEQDPLSVQLFTDNVVCARSIRDFRNPRPIEP
jgi:hypothetical protein